MIEIDSVVRLTYESSLSRLREINSSFDIGVLRIAYHGDNRNGNTIPKAAFERSLPTIWNCPVVCNYIRDTDSIGAHDVEIVKKNQVLTMVNATDPVGVVPESAVPFWETVEEDDGTTHEYLCVDVLLWKRQEAYKKLREDGIVAQSMEISVKEGELIDGVFYINLFEFTAFCLLGNAEPCFESASLEMFSQSEFSKQFSAMMQDAKRTIIEMQSAEKQIDILNKNYSEGGDFELEEKNALMAEFNITADMIDFSIEDLTLDELRTKFEEMAVVQDNAVEDISAAEEAPIVNVEPVIDTDAQFALADQVREELIEAIHAEKVETEFGQMPRYCFIDFDYELMEVYCYDSADWKLYGMTYTKDGDMVSIDFDSKKRKKYSIVDFDEGETDDEESVFASTYNVAKEQYAATVNQLNEANESIERINSELNELREYKKTATAELNAYHVAEFREKFSDLAGIEEFESLCENIEQYNMSDFEDKCFAIRGRNTMVAKYSHTAKAPKLKVVRDNDNENTEPYGDLFVRYQSGR